MIREFDIHATRECIDNSKRNDLHWCVFALAVIYSIPGAMHVMVDKNEVRFTYNGYRYVYPTPEKTARIAKAHDMGEVSKEEMSPWRDKLKDVISIEPSSHRRPSAANKRPRGESKKAESRCNRWNGRKI